MTGPNRNQGESMDVDAAQARCDAATPGFSRGWLVWQARWDTPLPPDALRFRDWADAIEHVTGQRPYPA